MQKYFVLGTIREFVGSHYDTSGSVFTLELVDLGRNEEELNPLAISHTPMNTSQRPPGSEETRPRPDPMTSDNIPKRMIAYPIRPQTAKNRGTNFALYNV